MNNTPTANKNASTAMVIAAFATVYIVWGSTYFFIQKAVQHIPPMLMGAIRFLTAGLILMTWLYIKGYKIFSDINIKHAAMSGLLMLFIGNGAVIWTEQYLPSSLAAVLASSSPIWFVLIEKPKWKENFSSKNTLTGLLIGFIGVIFLFYEKANEALFATKNITEIVSLGILLIGCISWAGGSIYAKYKSSGNSSVNTAWQMIAAGVAFLLCSLFSGEALKADFAAITTSSWLSLAYLIVMGSLVAYSAYVWLLQVRTATQVSTSCSGSFAGCIICE
jgi:drug/metabolite transporter (DMT)-like permease